MTKRTYVMIGSLALALFVTIGAHSQVPETDEAQTNRGPVRSNRRGSTEIAVQPFSQRTDAMAGETQVQGQMIVQRGYDVQLPEVIQHIPLFTMSHQGLHHPEGNKRYDLKEVRAKCIAERLSIAWSLMDEGGHLEIAADNDYDLPYDLSKWRLTGPYAPTNYPDYSENSDLKLYPAIYVYHKKLGDYPLRVLTIYPEDASAFQADKKVEDGQGNVTTELTVFTPKELAEYFVALIKAHHLLFHRESTNLDDYKTLEICRTREGEIFREICIRAQETVARTSAGINETDLKSALARIAMSQRERLVRLAYQAPRDWFLRSE